MNGIPESELVAQSKEGSQEAFTELFNRYKEKIMNYIHSYIGSFAEAQELTQEAFLSAYRHIGVLHDATKFSSWIYSIATNLSRNFIVQRRRRRTESLENPINPEGNITLGDTIPDNRLRPDTQADRQAVQEEIQRAIDALPPHYREVLLLCDGEGLSYEKTAETLHWKVGTVASRLSRARRKFRELFQTQRK